MSLVKVVRDNYDAKTVAGQGWRLAPIPGAEAGAALRAKLLEEVAEYLEGSVEELADVLEVVFALAAWHDLSISELLEMALAKRESKGGFDRRLGLYLDPPEGV